MKNIVIVGLGYVGLNLALIIDNALRKQEYTIIGLDVNKSRIKSLINNYDSYSGVNSVDLEKSNIKFIHDIKEINNNENNITEFIVCVPTPVYSDHYPNFTHLVSASESIGKIINKNDLVIYESTVYPGATEEICIPILEKESNLKSGTDFYVGFSPERINPGDSLHQMGHVTKLISGQNEQALDRVYQLYSKIFHDNVFKCSSIKVAESSKILENTQRDINIALINEFALLTEKMDISIHEVLDAAKTKWNFVDVKPGFPGGECIPVDPYYYIDLAGKHGVSSEMAKLSRDINSDFSSLLNRVHDGMSKVESKKILVLGLSYKHDVPDLKNSMGVKLISLLKRDPVYQYEIITHDPIVDQDVLKRDLNLEITDLDKSNNIGAIILMQGDKEYIEYGLEKFMSKLVNDGCFYDIPGAFHNSKDSFKNSQKKYWGF